MSQQSKSWFSIVKDAPGAFEKTISEPYVFEDADDKKVIKLPPTIDKKHAAIKQLGNELVKIDAQAHALELKRERIMADIKAYQDAITEQMREIGLVYCRPEECND